MTLPRPLNLLLFGAPGSGKGTQSALLKKHYHLRHISTGDLFRKAKGSPLGTRAQTYMNQGKLVPDSIVIDMIKNEIKPSALLTNAKKHFNKTEGKSLNHKNPTNTQNKGFILDGFPRTQAQALALDALLHTLKMKLNQVLYLQVPENILIKRVTGRRVAEKSGLVYHIDFYPPKKENICDKTGENLIQRKDDTEDLVRERLKNYHKQTAPLIEYYQKQNLLLTIQGVGSSEEVFSKIQKSLNQQGLV